MVHRFSWRPHVGPWPRLLTLGLALVVLLALTSSAAADEPPVKDKMIPTSRLAAIREAARNQPNVVAPWCYDAYESDDYTWEARPINLYQPQGHVFCLPGDQDFVYITAQGGVEYVMRTYNLGFNVDTVLELYDYWGNRVAFDDDGGGWPASRIVWRAPYSGTFFLMARDYYARGVNGMVYSLEWSPSFTPVPPVPGPIPLAYNVNVDRGCGAYYRIGSYIQLYLTVPTPGYYSTQLDTYAGSRVNWSGYLNAGVNVVTGVVGSPSGPHTITLMAGTWPSCTFQTGYGGIGVGPEHTPTRTETVAPAPDARLLEMKETEF